MLKMMKNDTRTDLNINRDSKRVALGAILAAMLIGISAPLANADTTEQAFTLTSATSANGFLESILNQSGEITYNVSALSTPTPKFNFEIADDYEMPARFVPASDNDIFHDAPEIVGPPASTATNHNDEQFGHAYDPLIDSMFLNQAGSSFGAPAAKQGGLLNIKF